MFDVTYQFWVDFQLYLQCNIISALSGKYSHLNIDSFGEKVVLRL